MARVDFEDGWEAHLSLATDEILTRIAGAVAEDARRYAPVDTGHLRDSIHPEPAVGGTARVVAEADYAGYVEMGHRLVAWGHETGRFVDPQPFLRPALYQRRSL